MVTGSTQVSASEPHLSHTLTTTTTLTTAALTPYTTCSADAGSLVFSLKPSHLSLVVSLASLSLCVTVAIETNDALSAARVLMQTVC